MLLAVPCRRARRARGPKRCVTCTEATSQSEPGGLVPRQFFCTDAAEERFPISVWRGDPSSCFDPVATLAQASGGASRAEQITVSSVAAVVRYRQHQQVLIHRHMWCWHVLLRQSPLPGIRGGDGGCHPQCLQEPGEPKSVTGTSKES